MLPPLCQHGVTYSPAAAAAASNTHSHSWRSGTDLSRASHEAVHVLYVHFQVGNSFCSASPWLNSPACNYDGGDCWCVVWVVTINNMCGGSSPLHSRSGVHHASVNKQVVASDPGSGCMQPTQLLVACSVSTRCNFQVQDTAHQLHAAQYCYRDVVRNVHQQLTIT
jgi:hypothetical protein